MCMPARSRVRPLPRNRRRRAALAAKLLCLAVPTLAAPHGQLHAQTVAPSALPTPANGQTVEALQARVEMLERRLELVESARLPPPPTAGAPTLPGGGGALPPAPGGNADFEVDPEAAERALERTLTQTGNLLLPPGRIDLTPSASYTYTETDTGRTVIFADADLDGQTESAITDTLRFRRDEFETAVTARVGLPYDSQVEARIPVTFARERVDQPLLQTSSESSGFGLGNIGVAAAKTIIREDGWVPDVIARVNYDSGTGPNRSNGVLIDDDFHELGGSISLLKRQDPLAFTGNFEYRYAFAEDGVRPGALYGVGVGAFLALSPETSLNMSLGASYRGETRFDGRPIEGSEQRSATASFGISSVLDKDVLLNFSVGVGLTEDAPDFSINLSLPVRLDLR